MLIISPETLTGFVALLEMRAVPSVQYGYYKQWLRYYLDFCSKHRLADVYSKSPLDL